MKPLHRLDNRPARRPALLAGLLAWLCAGALVTSGSAIAQTPVVRSPASIEGALNGTLKKAAASGTLLLGYRDASLPFAYTNPRGEAVGYSVDLCREIAEAVSREVGKDLDVKWVPLTSENRFDAVTSGKVDVECGTTTSNVERQKIVAFSPIMFVTGTKLMVRKTAGIRSYRDLAGKTVAVIAGTTNAKALAQVAAKFKVDFKVVTGKDRTDTLAMLTSGQADAFASDDVLLYGVIAATKAESDYIVVGDFLSYEPYGLMFRKGDADFAKVVNRAFQEMAASRELEHIYNEWFMRKLRTGERLGLPMSPQLEEIISATAGASSAAN